MKVPPIVTSARDPKFNRLLKRIKKAKGPWYHKHFPGYFYFLFTAVEGFFRYPIWAKSWLMPYGFCFSLAADLDWYWNIATMERSRTKLIAYITKQPKRLSTIHKEFIGIKRAFLKNLQQAEQRPLRLLTNDQIVAMLDRLYSTYYAVYGIGAVSEALLTTGGSDWFEDMIARETKKKLNQTELPEIVGYLAAPVTASAVNNAHESLLRVAIDIKQYPVIWQLLINNKTKEAYKRIQKHKRLCRVLQRHADKYHWIENNYTPRPPLSVINFLQMIAECARQGNNIKTELRAAQRLYRQHREDKRRCINRLQLGKRTIATIRLSDLMTEIHDFRKESVLRMNGFLDSVLKEVARRTGVGYKLLLFATTNEINSLLLGIKVSPAIFRSRKMGNAFFFTPNSTFVILSKEIPTFRHENFIPSKKKFKELRGVVASRGRAAGVVRVIYSGNQLKKFKKGEILVVNNTTPEFVPAMKKAVAIITEQGGLTTHAAIISRELGVPCVIGVTSVTDILKSGDRVKVDANKGRVIKL
ncbi:PEP-utilizing enzyme [Patescibacteria group bacterium]